MTTTSFKQMRTEIYHSAALRGLILEWYDGSLSELFSFEQRHMLSRLYHRAHKEFKARSAYVVNEVTCDSIDDFYALRLTTHELVGKLAEVMSRTDAEKLAHFALSGFRDRILSGDYDHLLTGIL